MMIALLVSLARKDSGTTSNNNNNNNNNNNDIYLGNPLASAVFSGALQIIIYKNRN